MDLLQQLAILLIRTIGVFNVDTANFVSEQFIKIFPKKSWVHFLTQIRFQRTIDGLSRIQGGVIIRDSPPPGIFLEIEASIVDLFGIGCFSGSGKLLALKAVALHYECSLETALSDYEIIICPSQNTSDGKVFARRRCPIL